MLTTEVVETVELGEVRDEVSSLVRFEERVRIVGETVGSERCAWSWMKVSAVSTPETLLPMRHCLRLRVNWRYRDRS